MRYIFVAHGPGLDFVLQGVVVLSSGAEPNDVSCSIIGTHAEPHAEQCRLLDGHVDS